MDWVFICLKKQQLPPTLAHLFQLSFDSRSPKRLGTRESLSHLQERWKVWYIDYRLQQPVRSWSTLLQLTSNLMSYLEAEHKLSHRQHTFQSRQSWESHLIELTWQLSNAVRKGNEIVAITFNFGKAFGKVSQTTLIHKVNSKGISSQVSNWQSASSHTETRK